MYWKTKKNSDKSRPERDQEAIDKLNPHSGDKSYSIKLGGGPHLMQELDNAPGRNGSEWCINPH